VDKKVLTRNLRLIENYPYDGILLSIICYVLMNVLAGHFRKLTPTMYILAVLFILKYLFI
jgi:xanthine/uracil/vitamin C permease (AzgA family)